MIVFNQFMVSDWKPLALVCFMASVGLGSTVLGNEADDAFAAQLIDGMRGTRQSLHRGHLVYSVAFEVQVGQQESESEQEKLSGFEDMFQTKVSRTSGEISIRWNGSRVWSHYQAMKEDGEQVEEWCIRTSTDTFVNRDPKHATRTNPEDLERAGFAIDPRVLGVCIGPASYDTVERTLFNPGRAKPMLVKKDVLVDGRISHHVRWDMEGITEQHFCISESSEFPVYRHWGLGGKYEVTSWYDEDDCLPTRTWTRTPLGEGRVQVVRMERTESNFGIEVPDSTFLLSNLGLGIGQEVVDYESQKRLGYWDGVHLVKRQGNAYSQASARGAFEVDHRSIFGRWWICILLGVLAVVSWVVIHRYR
ncbi:hypothetical protein [Rhodopirellula sp. P2]|uniref:hypothetical protein n=1 Tax=Rhodopirellula sp. P2 TaxID=2127060 RepID=UPI00236869D1|nr:hypothetical protein [Rhodopirellula sp. P2]WDQ17876.1 hypothetical protein PSR62_04815 [Rhodopirellula sp. P2]